jgi:polysaccharide biosynthesis/export protein
MNEKAFCLPFLLRSSAPMKTLHDVRVSGYQAAAWLPTRGHGMIKGLSFFLAALCLGVSLGGCAGTPPTLEASQAAPLKDAYQLAAGDKVRITVFNEPTLTGEYNVTAEGSIAFPLIGIVRARDETTEQLSDAIRTKLSQGFVNNPSVSTEVLDYRPYYILGEVNKPGQYPFANGLTIEQAVAAAGGFTYRANRGKVFLRRRAAPERTVELNREAVQVLPGDTIRVGERYF